MGDAVWKVLGTGGAIAAGVLANKVLVLAWRKGLGGDPPVNPESDETSWGEAVAWAVASGAIIGVARLAWRKNAATYYKRSAGHLPAGLEKVD